MAKKSTTERGQPLAKDRDILDRMHDRFTYCVDRWTDVRSEAKMDMRHVKGDPWDPAERLARVKAKRPVIALDELGQYENQVVNEVRANPRAIKFSPVGDGANDATARFYANKAREIEYRSHAQQHYTRAFQNMVERSYGYTKLLTEFVTDKPAKPSEPWSAFSKRLLIGGVADPDSIYPDPDFVDATGRDWKYLFEIESRSRAEFKREWPDAAIQDFTPDLVKYSNGWIDQSSVRIAAYWELNHTPKMMEAWEITNPQTGAPVVFEWWADESEEMVAQAMSAGGNPTKKDEREVRDPKVTQYLTNGVEILETTPWPGKWIPYVAMFGKMLWIDEGSGPKLTIMSMTRLARDPNMLHAYYTSCEAEMIGMTPKVPWWVWKGSLDKANALKVQKANHEPVAFIEVDQKSGTNQQDTPSLPQRIPFEPPIQAIDMGKEGARRAIQASMGLTPLPTSAQRRNEKSGVALKQIEDSGQRGSYHFIDSYNMGIERMGELLEDLIPKVHDTKGETPVLGPDMKSSTMYIGADPDGQQPLPDGIEKEQAIPSIEGLHAVTIEVGPEVQSERQEASAFVDGFIGSPMMQMLPPPMALEIVALLVKLKNLGPIGEQISEVLKPSEKKEDMVPKQQVAEAVQEAQKIIETMQQHIKELEQETAGKVQIEQVRAEGRMVADAQNNEAKLKLEGLRSEAAMTAETMRAESSQSEATLRAETDIRLREMQDQIELLKLTLQAQVEGARLEHAMHESERGRETMGHEAAEERKLKGQTATLNAKAKQATMQPELMEDDDEDA